jgi:hypothetical protein
MNNIIQIKILKKMKEQKNDPAAKGNQNAPGQKPNERTGKDTRSQDQRNEQNQEQEEGTKLPGRETRTPVAGEKKDSGNKPDSGKGGDRKGL